VKKIELIISDERKHRRQKWLEQQLKVLIL
jgi:hypothetical protein